MIEPCGVICPLRLAHPNYVGAVSIHSAAPWDTAWHPGCMDLIGTTLGLEPTTFRGPVRHLRQWATGFP